MSNLPDKPSDLLRMALECLRECEDDQNYRIDMRETHTPGMFHGDPIAVDLAGAVMAKALAIPLTDYCNLPEFRCNRHKFWVLQCFEFGEIRCGLEEIGLDVHDMDFTPPDYVKDKAAWHDRMNDLAGDLAERGL